MINEAVVLSDTEEEDKYREPDNLRGVWSDVGVSRGSSGDRAARIRAARVRSDNPLLVNQPQPIDHDQLGREGVHCNPPPLRHREVRRGGQPGLASSP